MSSRIWRECFFCGETNTIILEEHHIYPKWAEKISESVGLDNERITVCRNCHKKLHYILSHYRTLVELIPEEEQKPTEEISQLEREARNLREKLTVVLGTLIKLEAEQIREKKPRMIKDEALVKKLEQCGIGTFESTSLIKNLIKEGTIYRPKEGYLKKT